MRVIPVIDLQQGVVVRGIAGQRCNYRPVQSQLTKHPTPAAVSAALAQHFGFDCCYVADLDAIAGEPPQLAAWQAIRSVIPQLWIDAGGKQLDAVSQHDQAVIGLESLASPTELVKLAQNITSSSAIFSLDLCEGRLWTTSAAWQNLSPWQVVELAIEQGFRRLILLDIADVGKQSGTRTLELAATIHQRWPQVELSGGGGVRGMVDLRALEQAGFTQALVASALHDGRLTPEMLRPHCIHHAPRDVV